ncbi:MAG: LLM class flavin-dependent oxidoreductase [Anaerolineaceae bacterium]|nr:LLM class flavin-dependent oxidoreductase [Anaerolineaceae bacterium]
MKLGINIIPMMPTEEIIETIQAAEKLGYEYCLLCDEGFTADVYVTLGITACKTSSIRLGPVTNGYTRHPAVTAIALATLNILSNGRAFVNLIAGGSMVLTPMGIPRQSPLGIAEDTIEIMRKVWSGEMVTWQGKQYSLQNAQSYLGPQDIPIWVSPRGDKMLALTGKLADGAMLMIKADLPAAFKIVNENAAAANRQLTRIYLDRIAYTKDLMEKAAGIYGFVILDTPPRQQEKLGLTPEILERIREAILRGGGDEAAKLVTREMIDRYQIAGTPAECSAALKQVAEENKLDIFMLNITSGGLDANIRLMEDVKSIIANL